MSQIAILYALASLLVVLGFVALLTTRIYVSEDREETRVDVPLLGKMKTNYPALVFVFLGVALALITFERAYPAPKTEWRVTGSLEAPPGESVTWNQGRIVLFPRDFQTDVGRRGTFRITARIEQGQQFEDVIQKIEYLHADASAAIYPKLEIEAWREDPSSSHLKRRTENVWELGPIPVKTWGR